ncbi:MAG: hypothetical protein R3E91_00855 [Chlamydiales bacterium]
MTNSINDFFKENASYVESVPIIDFKGFEFSITKRIIGAAAASLVIIGVCALIVNSLHQSGFSISWGHIKPGSLAIGLGISTLSIGGAAWIVHRACNKVDPLVHKKIFKHLTSEKLLYFSIEGGKESKVEDGDKRKNKTRLVDLSTLNKNQSGIVYFYQAKPWDQYYQINTIVILTAPIYIACSIAYHVIRMAIIPFWVATHLAIEACLNRPTLGKPSRYKMRDLVEQPLRSFKQIILSPSYGLAYMVAAIYSLVHPRQGAILLSKIERDWNQGASRAEGYWSVGGPQRLWTFANLEWNFFVPGCYQPQGSIRIKNNKIVEGKSLSKMVNEKSGYDAKVIHIYSLSK